MRFEKMLLKFLNLVSLVIPWTACIVKQEQKSTLSHEKQHQTHDHISFLNYSWRDDLCIAVVGRGVASALCRQTLTIHGRLTATS